MGEPEEDVDRSMYLFERFSQGIIDMLLTWMLPASALIKPVPGIGTGFSAFGKS